MKNNRNPNDTTTITTATTAVAVVVAETAKKTEGITTIKTAVSSSPIFHQSISHLL